ncbi:unnamed protein product [Cyclocybe aegerita]|uniref:DUF6532 domain-containing protein n=1 Tax=Cyclocybe aegerita TaxID=1973307 RepID=A0A8S0WUR2_CYCAE|nr:unnamed protein product [Cyclocybe aegerita]
MSLSQASDAPAKKPLQKSSVLPKQGAPTKAPLKQTNGPAKATAAQGGMSVAAGNLENFDAKNPGNGRPTRSNRSTRLFNMEKTSEVIGHDLEKINRKRAGTFLEESQDAMPGIPKNPMAPPATKRRKATKKGASKSMVSADPPLLKTAPKPIRSGLPSGIHPRLQGLNPSHSNGTQSWKEIDERSPSEDEQNALAVIQKRQSKVPDEAVVAGDLDILEEHHKKNRPNRAPQPARLEVAAEHQRRVQDIAQDFLTQGEHEESSDEEEEDPSSSEEGRAHAPRNSRFDGEVKLTTLGYYHGTFKDAIEQAKKEFRGYVMLHNGFPERSKHLHEAGHILTRVIENDVALGTEDIQTRNTNVVVFKEASTYRGKMKILARHLVPRFYKEELNPDFSGGNQLEQQDIVATNVAELLGEESPYLLNGKDEQGKSNNIAHPCIRELCIQHFYGNGQDSIAKTFEDQFKDAIPEHAIAVVMACVYNALEEYELGYFWKRPFKGARYKEIYETSLDLIEEVKASPYHKTKWDNNRHRWARDGMKLLNPATERRRTKMKVHLD